jgi:two-component system CheB/CheR fusion protein
MNNLLAGTGVGTLFVDHQLRIARFTPATTEVINLLQTDIGRPVAHIVSNLVGYDRLVEEVEGVLEDLSTREAAVRTKAGNWFMMRIRPYRTLENVIEGAVITFADITELKRLEAAQAESRMLAESIVATARECLLVLDKKLEVVLANASFYRAFQVSQEQTVGRKIYDLGNGKWNIPKLRELLERILPEKTVVEDFQISHDFGDLGCRIMNLNARRLCFESNERERILVAIEDVTDKRVQDVTDATNSSPEADSPNEGWPG